MCLLLRSFPFPRWLFFFFPGSCSCACCGPSSNWSWSSCTGTFPLRRGARPTRAAHAAAQSPRTGEAEVGRTNTPTRETRWCGPRSWWAPMALLCHPAPRQHRTTPPRPPPRRTTPRTPPVPVSSRCEVCVLDGAAAPLLHISVTVGVKPDLSWPSPEFLKEEVVVLLAAQFITLFNQTALEVRQRHRILIAASGHHGG